MIVEMVKYLSPNGAPHGPQKQLSLRQCEFFEPEGSSLLLTLINFEQGSTVDLTPFRASPAPKANDDYARATFNTNFAKVKNGLALGVRVNAVVIYFLYFQF
jgi:hypothetical protein